MSSSILHQKSPVSVFGVEGRRSPVIGDPDKGGIQKQTLKFVRVDRDETKDYKMTVTLRFDDQLSIGREDASRPEDTPAP